MNNKLSICIVGAGDFSRSFIPLFRAHPGVREVSLCDLDSNRLQAMAKKYGIARTFSSLEEVYASREVNAIGLFTPRWSHAPQSIAALRAGKHVFSAVPAGVSLEELQELVETTKSTGLTYQMAETSVFGGAAMYCRQRWQAGDFGHFVYGEGEYYHDMSYGMYDVFARSGEGWKAFASFPPMLYCTHSTSILLSVTGAEAVSVSCLGWRDRSDDGIFDPEVSRWSNPFSNQIALVRTSDGGVARFNEFRRIGQTEVRRRGQMGGRAARVRIYGTEGSYEEDMGGAIWSSRTNPSEDIEDIVHTGGIYTGPEWDAVLKNPSRWGEWGAGYARSQREEADRLPESFRDLPTAHDWSHHFLVHDFVEAALTGKEAAVSARIAARYTAPGIVAHASSMKDGEILPVPRFV